MALTGVFLFFFRTTTRVLYWKCVFLLSLSLVWLFFVSSSLSPRFLFYVFNDMCLNRNGDLGNKSEKAEEEVG
jgi:hypothetical protein